ncbi:hypothetical protein SMD44_p10138 (plasmid) [Streptomyces alboflavus]|uniref:Uncharacterized protein n=1 Tax=Streptomyces alboflavus TaxID=67267 RepID=A0A291W400_9ACTN|nr:hypothetical protein SMD44_p10138 [Streptomyces alboflavus]
MVLDRCWGTAAADVIRARIHAKLSYRG